MTDINTIMTDIAPPQILKKPLVVKPKTLMGPGPSNPHPRVTQALALPLLGHFHQATFQIMDEIKEGIKYIFQTRNELTLAVSASGHGGMEAAMCNLVEPGDIVLVLVNGIWGVRAADMATRYGAKVVTRETQPGTNFTAKEVEKACEEVKPKLLFVTHGESSTGVLQPINELGRITARFNCLLVVDTVASLGGAPVFMDKWAIDCLYTGSQKTLGAPPGITPISFSPKARLKIQNRKSPPSVFYWDMQPLGQYWACYSGQPRVYHHTISTPLLYALREALALVVEEGLENVIKRHEQAAAELHSGLSQLGLEFFVQDKEARLSTVTTVKVPPNTDWPKLVKTALENYDMEIAGGLGPTAGKVLRIGVMGTNACSENVKKCLDIIKEVLNQCKL